MGERGAEEGGVGGSGAGWRVDQADLGLDTVHLGFCDVAMAGGSL